MKKRFACALLAGVASAAAAAPAHGAQTWGANLSEAPDATCTPACIVHTKIQANGFPDTGSPGAGVVTQVKLKHQGDGGVGALVVLDPKGGNEFRNQSQSPLPILGSPSPAVQTFNTRIAIGGGDRLGLYIPQALSGDLLMAGADPDSECYRADPHAVGTSAAYASATFCSAAVLLQARVEPDVDSDGYGDETQDPDHGGKPPTPLAPEPSPEQLAPRDPVRTQEEVSEPEAPLATSACLTKRTGTELRDVLRGTGLGDQLDGRGAADLIFGLGGKDCLTGGAGNDRLFAGDGSDRLKGGRGRDFLAGGRDRDKLTGGAGADVYEAGTGRDLIDAAEGKADGVDKIDCGPGRDVAYVDRGDQVERCERRVRKG